MSEDGRGQRTDDGARRREEGKADRLKPEKLKSKLFNFPSGLRYDCRKDREKLVCFVVEVSYLHVVNGTIIPQ